MEEIVANGPHLELRSFPKRELLEEREKEKIVAKIMKSVVFFSSVGAAFW